MAHSVELLFDADTDAALRRAWDALADAGLPSQARHNAVSNRPHVTLVVADSIGAAVDGDLTALADLLPLDCVVGAPLLFGTGRFTLARLIVPSADLLRLQARVHDICLPHLYPAAAPHTEPGRWTPHATLGRRINAGQLGAAVDVIPEFGADVAGRFVALRRWDGDQRVEHHVLS
ncbi:2'-5' RNA ligase family protein [soil metagenome]